MTSMNGGWRPGSAPGPRLRRCLARSGSAGGHAAVLDLLAEARRTGDPMARADALSLAHHCVLGPGHGALRLELATELIGEASRTGRRGDLLMGLLWHAVDLFLVGDPHAERSLRELRGLLAGRDHLAAGFVLGSLEVMLAIRHGRFEEAEKLAAECARRGEHAGDAAATGWYAAQLGTIRWYQGRVAECLSALTELVGYPLISPMDNACYAGLAIAAAGAGDWRLAEGRWPGCAPASRRGRRGRTPGFSRCTGSPRSGTCSGTPTPPISLGWARLKEHTAPSAVVISISLAPQ
ncbi:hypothetical protein AB0H37_42890 [Actinomadura sp. NPDC023710]|uniref:hypothetical protein n=1 Tax=Actinomadura sp. NPDC023710 TaxID=3158219 RepID=UPI00340A3960